MDGYEWREAERSCFYIDESDVTLITNAILRIYPLIAEKPAPYLFRPYSAPEKRNRIVSSAFTVPMIENRELFQAGLCGKIRRSVH